MMWRNEIAGLNVGLLLSLSTLILAFGCGPSSAPRPASEPASPTPAVAEGGSEPSADSAAAATEADQPAAVLESLADLSPEDRALAIKQRICPVSDETLGSMGTPVKVRVRDRDVFICCESCEEDLLAKPDEFLAKLPK